jgi:hypothetical protein
MTFFNEVARRISGRRRVTTPELKAKKLGFHIPTPLVFVASPRL